jgi:hypothetical protein
MALEPDNTTPENWQLLRLKAKILTDDVARALDEAIQLQHSRSRLAMIERAQTAAQRTLRALSNLVP